MTIPVHVLLEVFQALGSVQSTTPPPTRPRAEQISPSSAMQRADNFADAMTAVLKCYHPTSHYQFADVIAKPWARQNQYGATQSAVVRITYTGISKSRYAMDVAVMVRPDAVRTHLVSDNAKIQAKASCELESWRVAKR